MRRRRGIHLGGIGTALALAVLSTVGAGRAGAIPMHTDGDTIAFDSTRTGNGDIYLVDRLGGAALLDVTPGPSRDLRPSWEPTLTQAGCPDLPGPIDPQRIAYQSDRGTPGDFDIQVVYPDLENNAGRSHQPVDVTNDPATEDTAPAWSPPTISATGAPVIAYESAPAGDPSAKRDIWVVDPANGSRVDLTSDPSSDEANPEWASQSVGDYLAYDSDRSGIRQIWIQPLVDANHDGLPEPAGPPVQVTHGDTPASDPSWVSYHGFDPDPSELTTHDVVYRTDELGTTFLNVLHNTYLADPTAPQLPFDGPNVASYPLTGDPGGDESPAWSPLGDAVVYDSTRADPAGANRDLQVLRGGVGPLTPDGRSYAPDPAQDRHPSWEMRPDCAQAIPHLPTPAPVTRGAHQQDTGGGGGSGGGGGGSGGGGSGGGGSSGSQGGGTGGSSGGGTADTRLAVRQVRTRTTGHGAGRRLRITLTLNRRADARVLLLRGRRTVVNRVFTLRPGTRRLTLRVPRGVRAGVYRLRIKVVGGTTVWIDRRVRIPR